MENKDKMLLRLEELHAEFENSKDPIFLSLNEDVYELAKELIAVYNGTVKIHIYPTTCGGLNFEYDMVTGETPEYNTFDLYGDGTGSFYCTIGMLESASGSFQTSGMSFEVLQGLFNLVFKY
jgi:hypothetical protein